MKRDLNKALGRVIKQLREAQGLSQQELADYTDMDRSYISDLERGRYNPTLFTVYRLAQILKVKPHELFEEVDKLMKI